MNIDWKAIKYIGIILLLPIIAYNWHSVQVRIATIWFIVIISICMIVGVAMSIAEGEKEK